MSQPRQTWLGRSFQQLVSEAEAGGVLCTACGTPLHPLEGAVCGTCRRSPPPPPDAPEARG